MTVDEDEMRRALVAAWLDGQRSGVRSAARGLLSTYDRWVAEEMPQDEAMLSLVRALRRLADGSAVPDPIGVDEAMKLMKLAGHV